MSITELPLVEALKTKMRWHQARQSVLAENVSNADTPRYHGKDLKAPNFAALAGADGKAGLALAPVAIAVTAAGSRGDRPRSRNTARSVSK